MSRKRLASLALVAGAALAAAGVAAAGYRHLQSTQAAAATFDAASVSHASSRTCVASDGTYRETTATYTGNASSSDPRLNGPLTIRAHSVVNTTSHLGWVDASFRVHGAAHGTLHAAISGDGAVGGLTGEVEHPEARLVASVSSGFSQDGGFAAGSLGTGSANGAGVVFRRGACAHVHHRRTVAVSHLRFAPEDGAHGAASGNLTLDVTRDANGAITSATVVFYVNYRLAAPATITGLALRQGAKGTTGPVSLDAAIGTVADADGSGNVTKVVGGVSGALAQALLSNPRGYYVELAATSADLRAQLSGFDRR
jgi:hypothetical protein